MEFLTENGRSISTSSDFESVQKIKEEHCEVSRDIHRSNLNDNEFIKTCYNTSDGGRFQFGNERFLAPEIIFDPHNICRQGDIYFHSRFFSLFFWCMAIQKTIVESMKSCDESVQDDMMTNIIVSGGKSSNHTFKKD